MFFVIFIPLVTTQINYLSTIDSEKIVQLVEDPIKKAENDVSDVFNEDITEIISIQDYLAEKISEVLNIK